MPIGFAHRGARAHAPENTLEAFALALEMGAGGLESDVWLSADGVAVLDHDGDVRGVPIPSLARSELPAEIPSLEDLYRECGTRFELSLDLKHDDAAPEGRARPRRNPGVTAQQAQQTVVVALRRENIMFWNVAWRNPECYLAN